MKKIICYMLTFLALSFSLVSCVLLDNQDKWNGSVATSFADGDGDESSPYLISSCAELAYLAQEVNNGNSFPDKHFKLTNDLDLNKFEWTPIGNGETYFSGIFDGADHSITNLKITKQYKYEVPALDSSFTESVLGLFGKCQDATLKNLKIKDAEIIMKDFSGTNIYSGFLVGYMISEKESEISNIKIINSKTVSEDLNVVSLLIGGIAGRIKNKSTVNIDRLETVLSVSIKSDGINANEKVIGGLFGGIGNSSSSDSLNIKNCSSDISFGIDNENCYFSHNFLGAIGASTGACSVSNIFSKVTIDKIYDDFHGYPAYTANAIIGKVSINNTSDKYQFKNLFGYVGQVDSETDEKVTSTQLYNIPEEWSNIFSEDNCFGCTTLPNDHGLPTDIWDLRNLSSPKIK